MRNMNGLLDEAYNVWLGTAISCCAPHLQAEVEQPILGAEKPMTILHHEQPQLIPPPMPLPQNTESTSQHVHREWTARSRSFASRASSRGSFSVRKRFNTYSTPSKPRIGAPTDFRHVDRGLPARQTERFRPLELSIYMPENQLSPILPHFGSSDQSVIPFPPAALTHTRSDSALSNFMIPRKPLLGHSPEVGKSDRQSEDTHASPSSIGSEWVSQPLRPRPSLPDSPSTQQLIASLDKELPKPPPMARLRAATEPPKPLHRREADTLDRVKSALQEKTDLERQLREIDDVIEERRSIYMSSRAPSVFEEEHDPMPAFSLPRATTHTQEPTSPPANPSISSSSISPSAPSSGDRRPTTAPARPTVHIPVRSKSFSEASAAFTSATSPSPSSGPHSTSTSKHSPIPPPPLPLVLQQPAAAARRRPPPPLRKKKSFSRVSGWLFPGANVDKPPPHAHNISLDSVTNSPRPVTSRDGFYQCVVVGGDPKTAAAANVSVSSLSSYSSGELYEPPPPPPRSRPAQPTSMSASASASAQYPYQHHQHAYSSATSAASSYSATASPATWTPDSSPGRFAPSNSGSRMMAYPQQPAELSRMKTFGQRKKLLAEAAVLQLELAAAADGGHGRGDDGYEAVEDLLVGGQVRLSKVGVAF